MSADRMEPGPEMDRAVCEALGVAPIAWDVSHVVTSRKSSQYGMRVYNRYFNEAQAKAQAELHFASPSTLVAAYPPVSTDRTAMWLVWDALVARGAMVMLLAPNIRGVEARIEGQLDGARRGFIQYGVSEPNALCRAALAALGTPSRDIEIREAASGQAIGRSTESECRQVGAANTKDQTSTVKASVGSTSTEGRGEG